MDAVDAVPVEWLQVLRRGDGEEAVASGEKGRLGLSLTNCQIREPGILV